VVARERRWLLALAVAAYLAAICCVRPQATAGAPSRDFEAYYAAGATWARGGDPYSRDIWPIERTLPGVDARRAEVLPFVNPPPLLPALALYARLPFAAATIAWDATLAIALLLLIGALLVVARRARDAWAWASALLLALSFGPISSDLALGQFALIAVAAIAVASAASFRGRLTSAAVATTIAALQPTLAPVLLAWSRTRRAVFAQILAAIALLAAWAFVARAGNVPSPLGYARLLRAHGAAEGLSLVQFAPAAVAHGLGASVVPAAVIGWIVMLLALAAACAIAWIRRDDPIAVLCGWCALAPLALPFFHEHDFALLLVPGLLLLARRPAGPIAMWTLGAVLLVGVDWLGIAMRLDGIEQSLLLLVALAAAIVAFAELAPTRVLLALLPIAACVIILANLPPLPVWPDDAGAFSIPPDAAIAAVWHAEQLASGMFATQPAASLFRLLPLAGAGILAWLSARRPPVGWDSKRSWSARAAIR